MRASSAVPIMYPPVRFGRRLLVDGAVSSSTNLDVAVEAGAELIVVAAPLAYDHDDPPSLHLRVSREYMDCKLRGEIARAEKAGAKVLVVRPNAEEAQVHGLNFLRSGGNAEAADLSHRSTRAALATPEGRAFGTAWRAAQRRARRSAQRRAS
jgi:predicted acylesterase/phospholipase RssA